MFTEIADDIWGASGSDTITAVEAFAKKFAVSKYRDTDGRAELPCKGGCLAKLTEVRNKLFLESNVLRLTAAGEPAIAGASFGTAKDKTQVSAERARATTLRLMKTGTRQLFCCDALHLKQWMEKSGLSSGMVTPQARSMLVRRLIMLVCVEMLILSGLLSGVPLGRRSPPNGCAFGRAYDCTLRPPTDAQCMDRAGKV